MKQFHQLLSGIFISCSSDGKISNSLEFLLNPKHIPKEKVAGLQDHLRRMLMCAFRNPSSGNIEWASYKHYKLMSGDCVQYALSALTALPLPVWPFFGDNNPNLNVFCHLDNYLSAYHQDVKVISRSESSIKVSNGKETLFVYYETARDLVYSAYLSSDCSFKLSFYDRALGSVIIDSQQTSINNSCPIDSTETLDSLQYDGKVNFFGINKSTLSRSFSSLLFLVNGEEALSDARLLIDGFIKLSDVDSALLEPELLATSLFKTF
ncbi:hypothetical protein OAE68_00200 [Synechococcus sp. AH-551-A10]|nr:hypothetical protein [Synechococcus sp. AH-551-A10]MDB4682081.1 hypothetical protein [Synechococcus sp. AH-551-A10]